MGAGGARDGVRGWRGRSAAIAAVAIAALIWSTSFALTKVLLETVPPLTIGAIRFSAAAVILAFAARCQPGWKRPPTRSVTAMGASGLLGITVYFALENVGVDLATASDATLVVASYPILTLLIGAGLGQERITPIKTGGMILAVLGVWLVIREGAQQSGTHRLAGDLVLVLGGVVWAGYNMVARRSGAGYSALTATYYQTCAGALGFVLLAPLERSQWQVPGAADLASLLYLAALCSGVAFLLYNWGLKHLPSATAVNILNLVPVFGLVAAVVVAGESIRFWQGLGGVIVIGGVILSLRAEPSTQETQGADSLDRG